MLAPFAFMLSTSLKLPADVHQIPLRWIPQPATLDNYRKAFTQVDLLRGTFNTLCIAIPSTVGGGGTHADGKVPRFREDDFRLLSALGPQPDADVADWPLTYDDLEPYYAAAERSVGVAGDAAAYFPPRDPAATATALVTLLGDAEAARRRAQQAVGRVRSMHDIAANTRRLEAVYDEALTSNRQ